MKMNEVAFDSELVADAGSNGNGHNHTLPQRRDSNQAGYEAGLASGREAGYREGYQAGFADGIKQTQGNADNSMSAAPKTKGADGCLIRLRGLPCAHCGVSLFSDETSCRCCGTPKAARAEQSEKPS
jgi:hypothetical protein